MKAVLTGASGFIGGEVFEQCISHARVTSIVVLSRRALSGSAANNAKVKVLVLDNFLQYPKAVLDELKDADFCIWSLGSRAGPTKEVEVGYTTAFGEAMSSVRGRMPRKPFRLVFLSGMFATSDQNASLRWLDGPRKTKGLGETSVLEFAEQQNQNGDSKWESYVVKPGAVVSKQWSWIVTAIFGTALCIPVDVLAKAMIDTAFDGDADKRTYHAALLKKGRDGA